MCRERRLVAAMNFQLRFSPNVLALRDLLERGLLGEIVDVEVRLQVRQPWETWAFMRGLPRLEVLYHSIHYLDTIRMLIGEPARRLLPRRRTPEASRVRRSAELDHPGLRRSHPLLADAEPHARLRREAPDLDAQDRGHGRRGAALDGREPRLPARAARHARGRARTARGIRWRCAAPGSPRPSKARCRTCSASSSGEDAALVSPVDDAIRTMAVVEACYISSAHGGTPVPEP